MLTLKCPRVVTCLKFSSATAALIAASPLAYATDSTFDSTAFNDPSYGLEAGSILNTQFFADHGITISGLDDGGSATDIGTYNTDIVGVNGADTDLEFNGTSTDPGTQWVDGNTDLTQQYGLVPIIQNSDFQSTTDGVFDTPNDDPQGGTITFTFDTDSGYQYQQVGLLFIDVDANENFPTLILVGDKGNEVELNLQKLYDDNSTLLVDRPAAAAVKGNNTVNSLGVIFAEDAFKSVGLQDTFLKSASFETDSSGSVPVLLVSESDEVIPEPGSALLGVGALLLGLGRRRR